MVEKKEEAVKKYEFALLTICDECSTEMSEMVPCKKCKSVTFRRVLILKEK